MNKDITYLYSQLLSLYYKLRYIIFKKYVYFVMYHKNGVIHLKQLITLPTKRSRNEMANIFRKFADEIEQGKLL